MFFLDKNSVEMARELSGPVDWKRSAEILNLLNGHIKFEAPGESRSFEDCAPMPFFLELSVACYEQVLAQGTKSSTFLLPDMTEIWSLQLCDREFQVYRDEGAHPVNYDTHTVIGGVADAMAFLFSFYMREFPDDPEIVAITHTIGPIRGTNKLNPHFAAP